VDLSDPLQPLLAPRSIALVGASADHTKLSGLPLFFLQRHGYSGALYPVNPRAAEVRGLRCYPSLAAINQPVDLAFLLVGAERVLDVIDECIATGVKSAIVAASGFAEVGGEGAAMQARLVERIRGTGLRVLGPNCMGLVNVQAGVAASFSQSLYVDRLIPGAFAFFSQSGAIGGSTLDMASSRGIGLSHWVSTGNQADIDVVECALAVVRDPDVRVIGLYLESMLDPIAYIELLEHAHNLSKTVIVLKSGASDAGAQAAISHTAAMVGNAAVFEAVSSQYGAVLARDLEELLDKASGFLTGRVASGKRVGVVTSSGGVGVILADEIERQGLSVARLSSATRERLAKVVPEYGSTNNPVDATATLVARMIGGEAGLWMECFLALADDSDVDQIIVGLTMIVGEAGATLADEVVAATERTDKPIIVAWLGADLCREAFQRLHAAGVPMFSSTARAVRVASALAQTTPRVPEIATARSPLEITLPASKGAVLTEWQSQSLFQAAGLRCPTAWLMNPGASREFELEPGSRYVVKVQSSEITHKSDVGAVEIGVDADGVDQAARQVLESARLHLPDAQIEGVMVQEMVTDGLEMLVGVVRDPWFGLMLSIGSGGTLTELLRDVSLRRLPVSRSAIHRMISELRCAALLTDARGKPPYDVAALVDAVERIAWLAESIGERLDELEINPLLVLSDGRGVVPADCLIRLRDQESRIA
jgi:acetate---CoA ligase (ADP-forming)